MTSPIQPIRVESIVIDGRLRRLRENVVDELMASIREIGLINPLLIRRPNGHLVPHLVAGWHRLEAVRRLGWELVPCCTLEADDVQAELNEIDENLMRAQLSSAERALHVGRRKELYEAQHPETRHGENQHTRSRQVGDSSRRFTAATAKKEGRSERKIQRDATRSKRIPRIAEVVDTSLDSGAELDALGQLPPDEQDELIDRAAAGDEVSAQPEPAVHSLPHYRTIAEMAERNPPLASDLLRLALSVLVARFEADFEERADWVLEWYAEHVDERPSQPSRPPVAAA